MCKNPDCMEAPCPCEKCGEWFDLDEGKRSDKWFPGSIICESCGRIEEREIELDEEIADLESEISEAEYIVIHSGKRLKEAIAERQKLNDRE